MEQRLCKAALEGSVKSLHELLGEDPLILDIVAVNCSDRTPLHVAAIRGHVDFVKEILAQNSELAGELDSQGSCPLHWASAKGHVEIVKALLSANPDMCHARNRDGRNPLHLAAIKGRVDVLKELIQVKPDAARAIVPDQKSATILHLCVQHNGLEALKLLLETMNDHEFANSKDGDDNTILDLAIANKQIEHYRLVALELLLETMNDREFANSKDGDDNTILDLAVAYKQIKTIKYLLASAQIDVNAITANTLSALDNILARSGPKDLEIGNSLDEAGGASRGSRDIPVDSSGKENGTNIRQRLLKYCTPFLLQFLNGLVDNGSRGGGEFMKEIRTGLMVVASVICSLTFQIGVNPPGGVWQDNLVVDSQGNPVPNPHKAGEAIMASTSPNEFRFLYKANVMSFGTSMLAMLFLIIPIPLRNNALVVLLFSLMLSTLCTVAVTYSSSIGAITPADLKQLNLLSLSLALTCVLVIPLLTVIGILRLGIWLKSRGLINVSQPETPPSSVDINHASNRNQEDFQNIHDLQ